MLDVVCARVMVEVGNWEIKDFFFYHNPLYLSKMSTRNIFWHKGYMYYRYRSVTDAIQGSPKKTFSFQV